MKHILKGQIPDEYALDYDKTFVEQSDKIYKKLIPELKKLMSGHYNLSEFDKDELLSILVQNGYHSIEQSDSEDETRQKLPNNKQFLHVYDHGWCSEKLKYLFQDVLDLAAEEIQHAKKQQEQIYDDDTYFTYSKLPENTPEWAYNAEKIRNEATDIEMLEYGVNDNNDKMIQYDDVSLTDPNLDYLLNSAEINLIQPKDLDEIGKSLQSQKNHEKKRSQKRKKKLIQKKKLLTLFSTQK
ncbi:hypothetical protein C1645_745679 [Glomus cerebriforme]|uniref:Uncharacterized protein n=1 Tax=Glomus cerebriforme TaxID=658196 RepID=A0A397S509_9GLOM|nr:hypothetical protein C1645_745679 [Glomus cerebriforme]